MSNSWSRRGFLGGMAAFAALCGRTTPPLVGKKWFRGTLHAHSIWSDGRAFPEEVVEWYKSRGYHFLCITDHNVLQDDSDAWVKAQGKFASRHPTQDIVDRYLNSHPLAEIRRSREDAIPTAVRLRTYEELRQRYDEAGLFAIYPGYEMTHSIVEPDGMVRHVHMNAINVPDMPPQYRTKKIARQVKGVSAAGLIRQKYEELEKLPSVAARSHLFVVNHPFWRWYDLEPQMLIDNPEVRFFEVCNGGSKMGAGDGLPVDGLDADRFWDAVNAFRVRRGQPLLFGIGTDDAHYYDGKPQPMCIPGNAWCSVRANSPCAEDILPAMCQGDFFACEGLEAEDVSFDQKRGMLSVSVAAAPTLRRKISFIVSKRDFRERPIRTDTITLKKGEEVLRRKVSSYAGVGVTVKEVVGEPGEPVLASYVMAEDDLYVRARIESTEPPLCRISLHPKNVCCWTQPYVA